MSAIEPATFNLGSQVKKMKNATQDAVITTKTKKRSAKPQVQIDSKAL